jgi:DNA repair protein RadD
MKPVLRSYQSECIACIWEYFQKHFGNPVCALPTGTGKSVVIAGFLESIYKLYPSQKVLVMTHVKELIGQNYARFIEIWPTAPAGIYSAGLNKRDTRQKIIFCGIASVAKRAHEFGPIDLIIVDECHLISPEQETMYQRFFASVKKTNPLLKIIGFTATHWRLGHGELTNEGGIFTDVCFDITHANAFNRLIAEGFLSPLIPKRTELLLNIDGVHIQGGEFVASELQNAVDKSEITYAALREAVELKEQRKHWLIFGAGVDHAIHISEILNTLGVSCKVVHSKMSTNERDTAINDFKTGKIQAISCNNVLTTGFDSPWIDLILCLRPTTSSSLMVQMFGRGTRPYPGKENCLVLDFAGNTKRLGPINDPVIPKKKGKGAGEAPVKVCPQCNCYVHASVRFCTGVMQHGGPCNYEFVFETKLKQGASTEELIRGDLPVVETFKINHINYTLYQKLDRPPSMKVSYYCKYRMFEEYVCIEHPGFASHKARKWLRDRWPGPIPETTNAALAMAEHFKTPTHMRVWINKKYPEILKFCYDGTAFGTEEASVNVPSIETYTQPRQSATTPSTEYADDDIPF